MTPKRILLAALGVLAALVAVLFVTLSRSSVLAEPDITVDSNREREVRAADVLEDARANSAHAGTRGHVTSNATNSTERLPSFAETSGLRIVVLSNSKRTPVPAADVRVWEHTADGASILMGGDDWIGPDFEAFMNTNGRRFVTDPNGEFEMPRPGRAAYVCARHEDQFGWMWIEPGQGGLAEIEMIRSHAIVARVRDSAGVPRSGIRVAFGGCDDGASLWEAPTNAKGEVRVPAIEVLTRELGLDDHTPFALRLCIPEQPRIEQWFTLADLPSDTIEFTLPATGAIRVTIVDEMRQIVPVSGSIQLMATYEDTRGRPRIDADPAATKVRMVDGVALFTRVGLDLQFELEADMPGTGDSAKTISGPNREDETVEVELALEQDHTLLRGRLLDENGVPLANQTFDWRRMLDDDQAIVASGRDKLVTDAKGCFLWTLRRSSQATGPSTHRTGYLCELGSSSLRRQATIRFGMEYTSALTNLGDIVLRRGGPLVTGRVVDEKGAPVANAMITLLMRDQEGTTSAPTFDAAKSDSAGAFSIFGPCLTLNFTLHADGPLMRPAKDEPFSCTNALGEVVLKVTSNGGLEGTARVDHDSDTDELEVSFTPDGKGPEDRSYANTRRVGDRIFFEFAGEVPSTGSVGFHVGGDGEDLVLAVARITIVAGRITRAPELVDVDLRGKLPRVEPVVIDANMIELTIVDSLGRAVPRGVISARSNSDESGDLCTFGNGRARIAPAQLVDRTSLEIWAPNCRVAVLTQPFSSRRIALAPEFEVEFRLEVPRPWREAKLPLIGYVWMPEVEPPQFQPIAFERMQPFRFDERGRGNAGLPCAGSFVVFVVARRMLPDEGLDDHAVGLMNGEFVVRETDGTQVVELVLDPDSVNQCNEDLGLK